MSETPSVSLWLLAERSCDGPDRLAAVRQSMADLREACGLLQAESFERLPALRPDDLLHAALRFNGAQPDLVASSPASQWWLEQGLAGFYASNPGNLERIQELQTVVRRRESSRLAMERFWGATWDDGARETLEMELQNRPVEHFPQNYGLSCQRRFPGSLYYEGYLYLARPPAIWWQALHADEFRALQAFASEIRIPIQQESPGRRTLILDGPPIERVHLDLGAHQISYTGGPPPGWELLEDLVHRLRRLAGDGGSPSRLERWNYFELKRRSPHGNSA